MTSSTFNVAKKLSATAQSRHEPVREADWTTPLVQILHHDGRDDEAWATMAEHGCDHDLAMRLAGRREADHPLDARV